MRLRAARKMTPGSASGIYYSQKRVSMAPRVGVFLASWLVCFPLAGCASEHATRDNDQSIPTTQKLPDHLCDSGISTSLLRDIYPKGASGPVQMIRGNQDTGNIHNFMTKKADAGNSVWGCWVQFGGDNAEKSAFRASIVAIAAGNSTSLGSLGRTAGYHAHDLSLGVIRGVNGPQHSVLDFPCQVTDDEKVTMRVIMLHPIDEYAADSDREHMVRVSAQYISDLGRYVVDTLHLCKNLPEFPSGEFKTKPIPDGLPKPSGVDG